MMVLINSKILVPSEMVIFALKYRVVKQVNTYLATKFYTNGTSYGLVSITQHLADLLNVKRSTIYNHFNYLLEWDWIGKNEKSGIYFFRSIDTVFNIEDWEYRRSAIMKAEDLQKPLEFMIGALMSSLIKSGKQGKESERFTRRSLSNSLPVSHSFLKSILNIDKKTAQNYRKRSECEGYIKSKENLIRITDLRPFVKDLLKTNGFTDYPVRVEGSDRLEWVSLNRVRFKDGNLFFQKPSLITSNVIVKSRKNRSPK